MKIRRNKRGKFSKSPNISKFKRFKELVFIKNWNKKKEITPLPSFPFESDHSYCTSDNTNPEIHEEIEFNFKSNSDDLFGGALPANLLPLDHCRYVCELDLIAQLLKHCTKCSMNLHLHNSLGVRPYGVTGIVYVKCHMCESVNRIRLGKTHYSTKHKTGVGTFDVNTKLATEENENTETDNGIKVTTDTCWQKKGSGRSYDSLSGVATLIGGKNKKFVRHSIRCKGCRICTNAEKKGIPPPKHKCAKNWTGSAKGMEPDMVVEMIKDLDNRGVKINELAGDDDSTGFNRASKLLPHSHIVKSSDRNHIMVNASRKLFSIKLMHKELSAMVINSILKNYSYTLSQNQGNPEGIVNGVRGMIDHMYGQHDKCDIKWCGYLKDPTTYRHRNLPYGKHLSSLALKND
ncbi:unnamed protein product [Mytilus coruscus]|uniref:Mutator-like transposase domain-containing protein n=1 Tax=Mytilus coruscus TaxID=42192 RepID=A0A6J8D3P5_MYTCO|nr:unnamed protein product [Mytilus coruscus]